MGVDMNALHCLAEQYKAEILKRQLPEGGWSCFNSHQWCTETTCLCLLALRLEPISTCTKGVGLLSGCQNPNGSWPAFRDDDQEGSWVTALVVITLIRLGGDWKAIEGGLSWLLETKGQESHWLWKWRYRWIDRNVRFDPEKYGWPWTVGASSWVVPTSFSLIALRQAFTCCRPDIVNLRIERGEEMLFNRVCPNGGWNAGNGVVYQTPLNPHPDVTSVALIALLRQRNHPIVQRSLDWLKGQVKAVPSMYGLSWISLALLAHQQPMEEAVERIVELHSRKGMSANCQTLALARLALQTADDITPF